ncbi:metallophosphoesterase family protein [Vitreoscilla stercoraria]|uniref:Metallophosphatase family protein n=1 Tax=Vitreoscilla stercoraria TaxID=61 RepID=A0ABY4E7Z0_VITST|nr:metallophosphoesterase family protein [Vitreoscilla stercoraria]UOO91882.1 metallophosphatase family protein [Vitreoscilla stercoraria]
MRYAVISDIHANVWALEAVLQDLAKHGVDAIVQLGDVLYGPLAPQATFECLQAASVPVWQIKGNQDDEILQAMDSPTLSATMAFVLQELSPQAIAWLRALPNTCSPQAELFACHGTPLGNTEYWLEDVSSGQPRLATDQTLLQRLACRTEAVLLCGHSHIPRHVRLNNGQTIINPGSVGLPAYEDALPWPHQMQTFRPDAAYGILEHQAHGVWQWQQYWCAYHHAEAAAQAQGLHRFDWAYALQSGRVLSSV